ncbi:MAG: hypothetical protein VX642_08050 [Bdellovibrionota bacterium]|nr:hypothetical protein [Bdellovibrionota bacterium]
MAVFIACLPLQGQILDKIEQPTSEFKALQEDARSQFVRDYISSVKSKSRRSPASADPNMSISKKTSKGIRLYEKYVYEKQLGKRAQEKNVDYTGDGKVDCKRQFYPGGKKLKKEVCDYNQDGLIDEILEMNRDGLITKKLQNTDSDKAFEYQKKCVQHKKDKSIALCEVKRIYSKKNVITSRHYEVSDLFLRESSKKQSRGVASLEGKLFSDEKLPFSDREIQVKKKELIEMGAGDVAKAYDIGWGDTIPELRKHFQTKDGYHPSQNPCLKASRDCCSYSVDYSEVKEEGDQVDYQSCLSFSMQWCSINSTQRSDPKWCKPDGSVTEGAERPCYECLNDRTAKILSETEKKVFNSEGVGEIVIGNEYFQVKPYSVMFHGSCWATDNDKPLYGEIFGLDLAKKECLGDPPKTTQGVRLAIDIARMVSESHYNAFTEAANMPVEGKAPLTKWPTEKIPAKWAAVKEAIKKRIAKDPSIASRYKFDEADGRLKVFCPMGTGKPLFASSTNGLSLTFETDPNTGEVAIDSKGNLKRQIRVGASLVFDDGPGDNRSSWLSGDAVHELMHTITGGHGYPKEIGKNPATGKTQYRCNWTMEPDYAYLCTPGRCFYADEDERINCLMKPGEHFVDAQNGNNDLSEEYMKKLKSLYTTLPRGDEIFKVVEDPKDCPSL